jgi:hypothetical protein
MDALAQGLAGLDFAKQREHAHAAGTYPGHGTEQEDYHQERGNAKPDQTQKSKTAPAAIYDSAPSRIKYRHRSLTPCRF